MRVMTEEAHKKTIYKTYRRFKWLVIGYILSIGISAVVTILLARLMGPANYGLYAAAFILPSILSNLGDLGMSRAAIYYLSSLRLREPIRSLEYFKTSLIAVCVQSFLFSAIIAVFAYPIANAVFGKEYLAPYIQIASLMIFYSSVVAVINGGLLSLEKQRTIALFIITTSAIRNSLALLLYVQSADVMFALIGQIAGYTLMVVIYIIYALSLLRGIHLNYKLIGPMLRYGFPYCVGAFIISLSSQFYNIMAVSLLDKVTYGNFSAAWFIFSATSAIPISLSLSFFPSFSEAYANVNINTSATYNAAVKFSATILLYLWLILGGLSDIFVRIVYGSTYSEAGSILALLTTIFVLSLIGWGIVIPLLLTFKETKIIAAISFFGVGVSAFIFLKMQEMNLINTVWLIPLALFIMNFVSTIAGLIYLIKKYRIHLEKLSILKMFGVVLLFFYIVKKLGIGAIALFKIFGSIQLSNVLTVAIFAVWVGIAYISLLIIVGALRREDYEVLRRTLLALPMLGIVDRVVEKAFIINEKVNGFVQKLAEKPAERKMSLVSE